MHEHTARRRIGESRRKAPGHPRRRDERFGILHAHARLPIQWRSARGAHQADEGARARRQRNFGAEIREHRGDRWQPKRQRHVATAHNVHLHHAILEPETVHAFVNDSYEIGPHAHRVEHERAHRVRAHRAHIDGIGRLDELHRGLGQGGAGDAVVDLTGDARHRRLQYRRADRNGTRGGTRGGCRRLSRRRCGLGAGGPDGKNGGDDKHQAGNAHPSKIVRVAS